MRLLLDEMYSQLLAKRLRERGHDVVSVHERPDLAGALDAVIFAAAQRETRAVLTNNVPHYVSIVTQAIESGIETWGLLLTDDRSMPRWRDNLGSYIESLDELMSANPAADAFVDRVVWLARPT